MFVQPEAFFLPLGSKGVGQRFCVYHPGAGGTVRGLVLYVHPLAEEMNKSRRMAAMQARAMAQAGFVVLQIDLLGCGDSSGDFGDATWAAWVNDVIQGWQWLIDRQVDPGRPSSQLPVWLWGLRAGCLVAVAAANLFAKPCHFIFWQPPSSGKLLLQQFLRLKIAGDMMSGQAKGAMTQMRQQLADGKPIEVAGYLLSSGLAEGLENSVLAPAVPAQSTDGLRLAWLEVSTRKDASLSPVSTKTLELWREKGFHTSSQIVAGPSFWQTTEIEDAPELIPKTLTALIA